MKQALERETAALSNAFGHHSSLIIKTVKKQAFTTWQFKFVIFNNLLLFLLHCLLIGYWLLSITDSISFGVKFYLFSIMLYVTTLSFFISNQ